MTRHAELWKTARTQPEALIDYVLALEQRVARPDRVRIHPLENWPHGHKPGLGAAPACDHEARQVFDLPERPLEVTEHRAEIKCCPHGGERVRVEFSAGVNAPVPYGPRFTSLMVDLNQQQRTTTNCLPPWPPCNAALPWPIRR